MKANLQICDVKFRLCKDYGRIQRMYVCYVEDIRSKGTIAEVQTEANKHEKGKQKSLHVLSEKHM